MFPNRACLRPWGSPRRPSHQRKPPRLHGPTCPCQSSTRSPYARRRCPACPREHADRPMPRQTRHHPRRHPPPRLPLGRCPPHPTMQHRGSQTRGEPAARAVTVLIPGPPIMCAGGIATSTTPSLSRPTRGPSGGAGAPLGCVGGAACTPWTSRVCVCAGSMRLWPRDTPCCVCSILPASRCGTPFHLRLT